jgi:hypothetical protein
MAVIFTQPVTGTGTLGPVAIADTVRTVKVTIAHWTGVTLVTMRLEMSFDGGVTWRSVCAVGPVAAPTGTYKNRLDFWVTMDAWSMCSCGEVYIPGHPANVQLLVHSDHRFQDIRALPDLSSIVFHTPDSQPATGLPLRQIRVTCIATSAMSSTFTVDVT